MKKIFLSITLLFCFSSCAFAIFPHAGTEVVDKFLEDKNAFTSVKTFETKFKKLYDNEKKAVLRSTGKNGDSLLSIALKQNNHNILNLLIKYGVDTYSIIDETLITKNREAISAIIKAFPEVLEESAKKDPFSRFCRIAPYKMIEEKLKNGAFPNGSGLGSVEPLHAAAEDNPDPSVLNLLIDYGAEVNKAAMLQHAAIGGNLKVIEALLKSGVNVDIRDKEGDTALMTVAPYWSFYICCFRAEQYPKEAAIKGIKALIKAGANVNAQRKSDGDTALRRAAYLGRTEVVKILIEAGANVNVQNSQGATPLIAATENWRVAYPDVIIALLNAGANPNIKDKKGRRAIDYARKQKQLAGTEAFLRLVQMSR